MELGIMADLGDKAQDAADLFLDVAMKNSRKEGEPRATGYCLFCGEPVPWVCRWCDADCRDDWEKQEHARRHDLGG